MTCEPVRKFESGNALLGQAVTLQNPADAEFLMAGYANVYYAWSSEHFKRSGKTNFALQRFPPTRQRDATQTRRTSV